MQVPKMLGTLRRTWAPEAFIVSFKLETDEQILTSKVMACVSQLMLGKLKLSKQYHALTRASCCCRLLDP